MKVAIAPNRGFWPERCWVGWRCLGSGSWLIGNTFFLREIMISGINTQQADLLSRALEKAKRTTEDVAVLAQKDDSSHVMSFLDDVLDLGDGRSLLGSLSKLPAEEAEGALQSLARLLKAGVVGYEYRKKNGQVHKVFVDVAMGTDLHRAPLVRKDGLNCYR
jgi:hypothetical protein